MGCSVNHNLAKYQAKRRREYAKRLAKIAPYVVEDLIETTLSVKALGRKYEVALDAIRRIARDYDIDLTERGERIQHLNNPLTANRRDREEQELRDSMIRDSMTKDGRSLALLSKCWRTGLLD